MTTLITLVIPVGGDSGPFNLSSNIGGYATPFETNIPALTLTAGYTTSLVPNGTTIIRVTSVGVCTNYIDIPVVLTPTTTTTSTAVPTTTTTTTTAIPTTTTTSSSSTSTTTSTTTAAPITTTTTTAAPTTTTTTTLAPTTTTTTTTAPSCGEFELNGGSNGFTFNFTNCAGNPQTVNVPSGDSVPYCIQLPYSNIRATYIGPCV